MIARLTSKKFIYALAVTIIALVHGDTQVALAVAPLYLGAQSIIDHKATTPPAVEGDGAA